MSNHKDEPSERFEIDMDKLIEFLEQIGMAVALICLTLLGIGAFVYAVIYGIKELFKLVF